MNGTTLLVLLMLCGGAYVGCSPTSRRYTTCEGHSAYLACSQGYIKVIRANYGRTDGTTCAGNRPYSQIADVHCFQERSLRILSDRCNGQQSCSVPATNQVFSDPCYGTYKYLEVSYLCVHYKKSVICEYEKDIISCDRGVIAVHHANYGRRDRQTCPHKLATTSDCYSPQTYKVGSMCNGKKSCYLNSSNSVYSDPCYRVHKYLEVLYSCSTYE